MSIPPNVGPPEPTPRTTGAFTVTVYDRDFVRRGRTSYESITVTVRHNALGAVEMAVPLALLDDADPVANPRLADLVKPGAHVSVSYDGDFLISGQVHVRSWVREPVPTVTLTITDDMEILNRVLGWPNPTAPVADQGLSAAYYTVTGPAETVVKQIVTVNAKDRLGMPVRCAADQGRGATITVRIRMTDIAQRVIDLADHAGIGITVSIDEQGYLVDCYEPIVRARAITEESGILTSWSVTETDPTVTRVVVGGGGTGTARPFIERIDANLIAQYGVMEAFADANDATLPVQMQAAGDDALFAGRPQSGLSLTLAETASFHYGTTFALGDTVTVPVAAGLPTVTEICREVVLTETVGDGLVVEPTVGNGDGNDPDRLIVGVIRRLIRDVNDLKNR